MKITELRTPLFPNEHRCKICGNYFERNEQLYEILKEGANEVAFVHKREFDDLCATTTQESVVENIIKMPAAGFKGFTEAQLKYCHAFIAEAFEQGFNCISMEDRTIKASGTKTQVTVFYDIVFKNVKCNHNDKEFLYRGLFMNELAHEFQNGISSRLVASSRVDK